MKAITIITIVVVALLTVVIFGLTWLAYRACLKAYRMEVDRGIHDTEIMKQYHSKKKSIGGLAGIICSYAVLFSLLGLFTAGIIYKASGENFLINNQTVLVIKSGSMADFYDDNIAKTYNYDASLHFDVGDMCVFEKVSEDTPLIEGEVYGYKQKDIIITHRLVTEHNGSYEFRGDNNPVSDGYLIKRSNIIYHYIGTKIPGVGAFVLYAQSYFGVWSLVGIIGVAISSEVLTYKLTKIEKARDKLINAEESSDEEDMVSSD